MGLKQVGDREIERSGNSPKPAAAPLDWGRIYNIGSVWYLGIVYLMYGFSYIIYMTFFAAYLVKEMGVEAAEAGRLWAIVGGLSVVCGILWGGLSD